MGFHIKMTKKQIGVAFLNLLLLVIQLVYLGKEWNRTFETDNWATIPAIIAVISFGINLLTIVVLKIQVYDFRTVFLILSYVFMFGRVWVAALGLEWETSWRVQVHFSETDMYHAALFCICCIQMLFLGMFSKEKQFKKSLIFTKTAWSCNALYYTGIILLVIAIPCRLVTDFRAISMAGATGYYVSIVSESGLWDDFAFLLIPGILCVVEAKPKMRWGILGIVGVYFLLVMSLTGDRRYYVSGLLALGLYFIAALWEKKRPNIVRIVLYGILAVFFLNFLQVVRMARNGNLGTVGDFFQNFGLKLFDFSELFVNVFGEFGITFYSVVAIVEHIPGEIMGFQYGLTIPRSLVSIVPLGGYVRNIGIIEPSLLIEEVTGQPVGGSLIGDMYANFGLIAIPMMFLVGKLINKLIICLKRNSSPMDSVIFYTCVFILINLVRASICEILRPVVWCTMIPWGIFRMMCRRNARMEKKLTD